MRRILTIAALVITVSSPVLAQTNRGGLPAANQAKIEIITRILAQLEDDRLKFTDARTALMNSMPVPKPQYSPSEIDEALGQSIKILEAEQALTRLTLDYIAQRLDRLTKLEELNSFAQRLRSSNQVFVDIAGRLLSNEQEQLEMLKQMQQAYRSHDAERWNSLNAQYAGIQARGQEFSAPGTRIITEEENILAEVNTFLQQLLADLQKVGFTGTKVVQMTAKSWINGSSISGLISVKGIMLKLGPNSEPTGPALDPTVNDFKMYQTFSAEAEFVNGKVVSARFLPDSLQIKAGKTFKFFEGLIYIKESTISNWKDQESVTFTRTVEALPQVLFAEALGNKNEGFKPIYSTLIVEIKGDKVTPHGYGSDFPSHKFWFGDKALPEKKQMQPSEYFK
jgi:hypothetical protein